MAAAGVNEGLTKQVDLQSAGQAEYAINIENGSLQLISPTPVNSAALIQGS
jgi:hypothetical protein